MLPGNQVAVRIRRVFCYFFLDRVESKSRLRERKTCVGKAIVTGLGKPKNTQKQVVIVPW